MADLLRAGEPGPAIVRAATQSSHFVLIADHAGREVPAALGDMGLSAEDRARHIAWDIGIAPLAEALAERLGAVLVRQRYSRLVIDCNRAPERNDAVPEISDGTPIPANRGLSAENRQARIDGIHAPYHAAIAAELAERGDAETVFVALHSFTPAMNGIARPWHAGVLYGGGDESFARAVLARLADALDAPVGDNQPYAMEGTDFTVPHHCFAVGRRYVELEIRQDLLGSPGQIDGWAELLRNVLVSA